MKKILLIATIILLTTTAMALFIYAIPNTHANSTDSIFQLSITGYVDQPSNFTLGDLQAMPKTTVSAEIYCVDAPNIVLEQGSWEGVKFWDLLSQTGVSPEAVKVALYASDGYSSDLSIDLAKQEDVILAYAKDGAPLNEGLRLVVPGHWGYKWISQVQSIKLVNYDFKGKWESQGYSDDAFIVQINHFGPAPSSTIIDRASPTPTIQVTPSTSSIESPATSSPAPSSSTFGSLQPQRNVKNIGATEMVTTIAIMAAIVLAIASLALVIKRKKKFS